MVYDIASPYFGVRKQGGNTFALPGGVFLSIFFLFSFSLDVFRVMTPRSWESWTNPLDRREELNVTVFFSSNRHRLKKCRMCQQDISWNCNGIFLSFYFFVDGEGCVASYSYVALSISYKLPIKDYTSNKSAFVFIRFGTSFSFFFFQFVFFFNSHTQLLFRSRGFRYF